MMYNYSLFLEGTAKVDNKFEIFVCECNDKEGCNHASIQQTRGFETFALTIVAIALTKGYAQWIHLFIIVA